MNKPNSCPTAADLRALLDDRLAETEQTELSAHLEACDTCRSAFDRLAAESRIWSEARGLGTDSTDPDTQAYTPEGAPIHAGQEACCNDDPPNDKPDHPSGLVFLETTNTPDRIGAFGPYEAIEILGRGGFGVVLKMFDPALHRVVALKVLAPQLAASSAARRRFVREARAAASVAHEHVVTIHSVDEYNGWPYLVMQYVGGRSLQERIDKTGPLEVKEILRIGMQTAAGLAAAHAQGLVHRDIKPANILLENGVERVKLTDFGLARAVDDPSLTQAGTVAGTPQYMSPEQAKGDPIDPRADLFSLGCVMYAMATGQPPFRGSTTMSVLRKVCDDAPTPIRASNSDIPQWLERIIFKLLEKDPARRFQTATEVSELLADHLSRLQQGLPVIDNEFDLDLDHAPEREQRDHAMALAAHFDVGPAKRAITRRFKGWHVAATVAALALLGVGVTDTLGVTQVADAIATVLRIKTAEGTLVVEVEDPEVQVAIDGGDVVVSGGGAKEVKLKAGQHQLQTIRDGLPGPIEMVTVSKGGKKTWSASFEPVAQTTTAARAVLAPVNQPERFARLRVLYEECGQELIAEPAQLEALMSRYEQKKNSIKSVTALVDTKRQALERAQKLLEAGAATDDEVKHAASELEAAEEQRARAEGERKVLSTQIDASTTQGELTKAKQAYLAFLLREAEGGGPFPPAQRTRHTALLKELQVKAANLALEKAIADREMAENVLKHRLRRLDLAKQLLITAQQRFKAGVVTDAQVAQANERAILAEQEFRDAEAARDQARKAEAAASAAREAAQTVAEIDIEGDGPRDVFSQATVIRQRFPKRMQDLQDAMATVQSELAKLPKQYPAGARSAQYGAALAQLGTMRAALATRRSGDDLKRLLDNQLEKLNETLEAFQLDDKDFDGREKLEAALRRLHSLTEELESADADDVVDDADTELPPPPSAPVPPVGHGEVPGVPVAAGVAIPAPPQRAASTASAPPVHPANPSRTQAAPERARAERWPIDPTWVEEGPRGRWFLQSAPAFDYAKRANRPVLVMFMRDNDECRKAFELFDSGLVKTVAKGFVCARLDLDHLPVPEDMVTAETNKLHVAENRARAKELGVEPPAFLVFREDGKLLGQLPVNVKAEDFAAKLEDMARPDEEPRKGTN